MRAIAAGVLLASLCAGVPAAAAEGEAGRSVFRIDPWVDGAVIGTTTLGVGVAYAFSSDLIHPRCPCSPSEVNAFDRSVIGNHSDTADALSNLTVGLSLAGALVLDGLETHAGRAFLEDSVVLAEALAVNGALVTVAKYTVQRPIPRVYGGQAPGLLHDPGGYRSFYSGHTSLEFAALVTASYTYERRHPGATWPWIVTVLAGASVGAERIVAGNHFYTDVLVGALAGSAVGALVPLVHDLRFAGGEMALAPMAGGVAVAWGRVF